MKPYDIKGEYTPEEVRAALTGIDGTRQLSYRYELLDQDNIFISHLDNVVSCSVDYEIHADIKRTAKFEMLETGSINYLKDRIKPYVRIAMPEEKTYVDTVAELEPAVWWRFDEPSRTYVAPTTSTVADGNTNNTRATALAVPITGAVSRRAKVVTGSGTVRSEFWTVYTVTDTNALMLELLPDANQTVTFEVYTAADAVVPLTLLRTDTFNSAFGRTVRIPVPVKGLYYVRVRATGATASTPTITASRPLRIEDSSGNRVYATGKDLPLGAAGLINDGGKALSVAPAGYADWGTDGHIPLKGGFTFNTWIKLGSTTLYSNFLTEWGTLGGAWKVDGRQVGTNFDVTLSFASYATDVYPNFTSTLSIPMATLGTTRHMFSVTIDPVSSAARLYLDAVRVGTFSGGTPISRWKTMFDSETLEYNYSYIYTDTTLTLDDYLILPEALSGAILTTVYQSAIKATPRRSGYCEWPMGVFLLTSPTRTMEDGNVITRSVDGYDQLSALMEDAFPYRYSIEAGAKYTDAIQSVLQTSARLKSFPFTDPIWEHNPTVIQNSGTSLTVPGAIGNPAVGSRTGLYQLNLNNLSISAKVTCGPDNPNLIMNIRYMDGTQEKDAYIGRLDADLYIHGDGTDQGHTYNSATMLYWRIREDSGSIYMELSSNGQTWVLYRTIVRGTQIDTKCTVWFSNNSQVNSSVATVTEMKLEATHILPNAVVKSTAILPSGMEWEPGTPKLTIMNDLLGAMNYESAYYDEDGVFVGRPYITPQRRGSEYKYATDESSVITGNIDQTVDIFGIPNTIILTVSEPDRAPLTGIYINEDPLSPTSTVSRGRTIVDHRTEQDAADQFTLDSQAERIAFEASQVYEVLEFETALMPIHSHGDVYDLEIDGLKVSNKYSEQSWSMDLENGSTMKHRVRRVIAI